MLQMWLHARRTGGPLCCEDAPLEYDVSCRLCRSIEPAVRSTHRFHTLFCCATGMASTGPPTFIAFCAYLSSCNIPCLEGAWKMGFADSQDICSPLDWPGGLESHQGHSVAFIWSGLLLDMWWISCPISMSEAFQGTICSADSVNDIFARCQNAANSRQSLSFPRSNRPCGAPTFDKHRLRKEKHVTEKLCLRILDRFQVRTLSLFHAANLSRLVPSPVCS